MNIIAVKKPSRKDREKAEEKEPEDPEAIESKRLRVERFLRYLLSDRLRMSRLMQTSAAVLYPDLES